MQVSTLECSGWRTPNALGGARGIPDSPHAHHPADRCLHIAGKCGWKRGKVRDPLPLQSTGLLTCLHFALLLIAFLLLCNFADSTRDHSCGAPQPRCETGRYNFVRTDHPARVASYQCIAMFVSYAQTCFRQQCLIVQWTVSQVSLRLITGGNVPFVFFAGGVVRLSGGISARDYHGWALFGRWFSRSLMPVATHYFWSMSPAEGPCLRLM